MLNFLVLNAVKLYPYAEYLIDEAILCWVRIIYCMVCCIVVVVLNYYAEFLYDQCCNIECHYTEHLTNEHSILYCFAQCRYPYCRYAECRGAVFYARKSFVKLVPGHMCWDSLKPSD